MSRRRETVTLRMLADGLGVSVSTVSRVLNSPGDAALRWGSAATIERIRAYADERGYSPNPQAASLRTSRSGLVGVLVPRLQDFVLATIYEGIEEAAVENGLSTFVTNSLDDPGAQRARSQMMIDRRVDGMIFGDAHLDHLVVDEVADRGVPLVLVSRRAGDHVSATCDDVLGGRLVGEHLVRSGRTRPAILAGQAFASTSHDRVQGAVEAFAEAGIEIPRSRIVHGPFDAAGGRIAAEQLLAAGDVPDAIFATNDFAAIGALGVLRDRGLRVPDDVALVGYNDTPLASEILVPLTTIRSPMHEMGRRGVELLIELIGGGSPAPELLEPVLVVRETA
ncbi:LacI family DNA-binding transcriptional regulator [Aeromicrobium alkaliterrae]|uniref:LacI family DNA-binding transcriptional regulator n=1 Tax=Aeromicrobium alkaliterrae TaxID=302168 RepID=UPI0031DB0FE0